MDLTPIAVALVVCVGLVTCSFREKIPEEAVRANADACQKLGRDPIRSVIHKWHNYHLQKQNPGIIQNVCI